MRGQARHLDTRTRPSEIHAKGSPEAARGPIINTLNMTIRRHHGMVYWSRLWRIRKRGPSSALAHLCPLMGVHSTACGVIRHEHSRASGVKVARLPSACARARATVSPVHSRCRVLTGAGPSRRGQLAAPRAGASLPGSTNPHTALEPPRSATSPSPSEHFPTPRAR
jgi:hypothetical protein